MTAINNKIKHFLNFIKSYFIDIKDNNKKSGVQEQTGISEKVYQTVVENSGTAIMLINKDRTVSLLNNEAYRLTGYSKDEMGESLKFDQLVASHDQGRISDYGRKRKNGKDAPKIYECDLISKKGEVKHVQVHIDMIPGTSRSIASIIDMSEILSTKDELRKKEEQLTIALETTSDGIWDWFPQTGQTYFSPRYYTMLGYEPWEFTQDVQSWVDLLHPDERRKTIKSIWDQLAAGDTFSVEYRSREKSGGYRWILCKGTAISKNDAGEPLRVVGTQVDITDQKEMLEALLNSELKYRTLYNNAMVGMVTFHISDGMVIAINEQACAMLGYDNANEVIGSDLLQGHFYNDEERIVLEKEILELGEIVNQEIQLKRKNGNRFWAMVSIKLFKDEDRVDAIFIDVSRRKKAEEQLHNLMFYDQLTRLPNKEMFVNRLTIEIVRAQRRSQMFAVVCLGLDNFKKINEIYGPKTGDRVLYKIGSNVKASLRDDDMVARFLGDQFMILLSDIRTNDDVIDVVKKIVDVLSVPIVINNASLKLTASMGIVMYPNDGDSGEIIIKNSESAMFMAKDKGKNSYVMFDHKMHEQLLKHFAIEEELYNAIAHDEFLAYYQPKVNEQGKILGMETLIRWQSSRFGMVAPMDFIPIAERTGLIIDIGHIILRKACMENKKWQDMGLQKMPVSVNLSPYQFRSPALISMIKKILSETGLEAQWLELEITESGIIEHEQESVERLNEIHALGISVSIDDFGTGYSSLSKLKLYPVDTLKIDKSFVDDLPHDMQSAKIATSIISLAENLGFNVIAEGVENKEQVDFLVSKNCYTFQGYYFYRPMPSEEFEKLLKN